MLLLMDSEPGMIVAGITDRLPGLVAQLEAVRPDLLLLEWELSYQSIVDLLATIHHLEHPPEVIYLSSKPEEKEMLLKAGVDHFVAKNAPPDELLLILSDKRLQQP